VRPPEEFEVAHLPHARHEDSTHPQRRAGLTQETVLSEPQCRRRGHRPSELARFGHRHLPLLARPGLRHRCARTGCSRRAGRQNCSGRCAALENLPC